MSNSRFGDTSVLVVDLLRGSQEGTAIGLVAITSSSEWMEQIYQRWRAATLEKISVLIFIVLAVLTLVTVELPLGEFGTLVSGWLDSSPEHPGRG